jgi:hypothetical protein
MKLVRLIKMCLNETYSKHLSDNFPIQNGLKQRDALSPLLFNFILEYAFTKVRENKVGLKLNGTHQLAVYSDDVNLVGDNIVTCQPNVGLRNRALLGSRPLSTLRPSARCAAVGEAVFAPCCFEPWEGKSRPR